MEVNHDIDSIRLTSSEIGHLWTSYILNSKSKYIILYVANNVKDEDIKSVIQFSLDLSDSFIKRIEEIFKGSNHPIPYGFSEKDVNINAGSLLTDELWLAVLKNFTTFGLSNYTNLMAMAARKDIKEFFTDCLTKTIELSNRIDEIALSKGMFQRTPYIPIIKEEEFAKSQGILGSYMLHKRHLDALEIGHIFHASLVCSIGEALLKGLSEIVKEKDLKKHMLKGSNLLRKHGDEFNSLLLKEDLSIPKSYIKEVNKPKNSPFSTRITVYFSISTTTEIINTYFITKQNCMRKDISLDITKFSNELSMYLKDGIDILIDKEWLEETPKNY